MIAREIKLNENQKMKEGAGGVPPRSFTCAIFRAVFDPCFSFFAPKPHRNACYAGYPPTETTSCLVKTLARLVYATPFTRIWVRKDAVLKMSGFV